MADEDKRQSPRLPYSAAFEYALHGDCIKTFQPGSSVNISEMGVAILIDEELEPGRLIMFQSKENELDNKIAIVRWSMKTGSKYKTGLMFI